MLLIHTKMRLKTQKIFFKKSFNLSSQEVAAKNCVKNQDVSCPNTNVTNLFCKLFCGYFFIYSWCKTFNVLSLTFSRSTFIFSTFLLQELSKIDGLWSRSLAFWAIASRLPLLSETSTTWQDTIKNPALSRDPELFSITFVRKNRLLK